MCALRKITPYAIEGVKVGAIMGLGDVIAQTLLEGTPVREVNVARTVKYAGLGVFFLGPTLKVWYGTLERIIPKNQSALRRGLKKMAVDQLCFAPPITLVLCGMFGALNGDSPATIKQNIKRDYFSILMTGYMLWPAAQVINFTLVPVRSQVIFAQIVAVVWNCYMSLVLNK